MLPLDLFQLLLPSVTLVTPDTTTKLQRLHLNCLLEKKNTHQEQKLNKIEYDEVSSQNQNVTIF